MKYTVAVYPGLNFRIPATHALLKSSATAVRSRHNLHYMLINITKYAACIERVDVNLQWVLATAVP